MIGIIGGSGFVGSLLIHELGNRSLKNFDKNRSPFYNEKTVKGNIMDTEALKEFVKGLDTVVLLAAEHRDDVSPTSLYYDVNVQGTQNVLDAMDESGVQHIIFTSSVAVYGLNKNNPDENHTRDPFNHYGKSKWQAEEKIKDWYSKNPEGKTVTIVRPTVIFGERNRGNVYNLLNQIASKKFLLIGTGENKKSMAYVGNVVAFILNQLQAEPGFHIFNYVDKPDYNMKELVALIENKLKINTLKIRIPYRIGMFMGYFFDFLAFIMRKKLAISSIRIKKFCATTQFNGQKAHSSFRAPFTLKEGIERTLEHEFVHPKEDEVLFYSE